MIFRRAEITTLEQVKMMVTAKPIPRPLNIEVVMASRGHMPSSCTRDGFWLMRPSKNCFFTFIVSVPP